MKNNKEWFDILREFRKSDICLAWIKDAPEEIEHLYDLCHITEKDYTEYNEEKDYRSLVAALYFTAYAVGDLTDIPVTAHNPCGTYCSCLSIILYRHGKHLNKDISKVKKKYHVLRKRYNIEFPERVDTLLGFIS